MSIAYVILVLTVVGALLYLVRRAEFIDPWIKQVIYVVGLVAVALWPINVLFGGVSLPAPDRRVVPWCGMPRL